MSKVNLNKTWATYIGKHYNQLPEDIRIKWSEKAMETLGVKITGSHDTHFTLNFEDKFRKIGKYYKIGHVENYLSMTEYK